MRFNSLTTLLAGLAPLAAAAAVPLLSASNITTAVEHAAVEHSSYLGYDPAPNSVAMHLEGLAGCYARCMLDQDVYFARDLGIMPFEHFCGFYWRGSHLWEWGRVRACALQHCVQVPCPIRSKHCDVPDWIYTAHHLWLVERCKGFREEKDLYQRHVEAGPDTEPY